MRPDHRGRSGTVARRTPARGQLFRNRWGEPRRGPNLTTRGAGGLLAAGLGWGFKELRVAVQERQALPLARPHIHKAQVPVVGRAEHAARHGAVAKAHHSFAKVAHREVKRPKRFDGDFTFDEKAPIGRGIEQLTASMLVAESW